MNPKALVVLSGGLDSTVTLHITRKRYDVEAITFYYGQKQDAEIAMARKTCQTYNILHTVVDISFLGDMLAGATSNVKQSNIAVPDASEVEKDSQPITYVPNRNLILLNIAVSRAEAIGADVVFCGLQAHDEYGYWDCTPDFLEHFNATLALNRKHPVRVEAPFLYQKKDGEILELISEYGEEEAMKMLEMTLTCYNPHGGIACGKCPSCFERLAAFRRLNLKDPIEYAA